MVVNTRNWLPGRYVLVAPAWVREINWSEASVRVDLSNDTIRTSPEYDSSSPIDRQYEARLYEHYDRPVYW
jgi:hypothetical protein